MTTSFVGTVSRIEALPARTVLRAGALRTLVVLSVLGLTAGAAHQLPRVRRGRDRLAEGEGLLI